MKTLKNVLIVVLWILLALVVGYMVYVGGKI